MNSILVILIAGIGDTILSTKALRALKLGHPDAEIHLLTGTQAASLAQKCKHIDQVWAFPVRELREDRFQLIKILRLISKLRKINFGAVINLYRVSTWSGALEMGLLLKLLKGREKFGHDNKGFGLFLDKKASNNSFENQHVADAMIDMAKLAGGIPDDKGIEIYLDKKSEGKWKFLFAEDSNVLNITINPGGHRRNRRWKAKNYALTADKLIEKYKAKIVLLGGPGEEHLADEIQKNMKNNAINLAGKLSLDDLISIINHSTLLITNDSAPMHIAAAVKTPVVAIFGPEDPRLFGPYTSPDLYRVIQKDIACRPCTKKNCNNPVCLDQITPDEVFEKCIEILEVFQ